MGPIPMPPAPEERRKEELKTQLENVERSIEAHRAMAEIAQVPQWENLKKPLVRLIDKFVSDLIKESDPDEMFRLQGGIRALSSFAAAPEDAIKVLERLRVKHDQIRSDLAQLG